MKRFVILLLIMSMLFSIVACGIQVETTTTESIETSNKPIVVTKPAGETVAKPVDTTKEPFVTTGGYPLETTRPVSETTPKIPTVVTPSQPQGVLRYPEQIKGVKKDLEDTTVQFIYVEGASGTYTADSLWVDIDNAAEIDAVDQQIIDRNNRIYEDLGINIEAFTDPTLSISGLYTFAKIYFDVQDPSLDVYCGYQYFDISSALKGGLLNLNTIVNDKGESVIDITNPCWATNYINSITYNDQMYWVTGDLALRYTGGLYCTFVNLDLYDMYVKNNYEGKSIYDIVNEKKWTMQTMLDMADMVDDDTDGNGKASAGDRLGIVFEPNDVLDGLAFGCKIDFSTRSTAAGQDNIAISLNTDTRAVKLAGYISTMWESLYAYNAGSKDSANMMPIFAKGNTLFAVNKLYQSSAYLSRMDRWAMIPLPLLDENQTEYGSGVHDSVTIYGISRYSNCPIAAAATLELMAYYSRVLVTPIFVESLAKTKENADMIDLIRKNVDTDFAVAWSERISNIAHVYRNLENVKKFSSFVKISSRHWPAQLKTLLTDIETIES